MFGQILWTKVSLELSYNYVVLRLTLACSLFVKIKEKGFTQFESLWEEVKKDN